MFSEHVPDETHDTNPYGKIDDRSLVSGAVRSSRNVSNALNLLDNILEKVSASLVLFGAVGSNKRSDTGVLYSRLSPDFTEYLFDQTNRPEGLLASVFSNDKLVPKHNVDHLYHTIDESLGKIRIELERLELKNIAATKVKFGPQNFVFLTGYSNDLEDSRLPNKIKAIYDCFIAALGVSFRLEDILAANNQAEPINEQKLQISERQQQCLQRLASGKTSFEISVILGLSEQTVNYYINNACKKLGAATRSRAVIIAGQTGLIDIHQ